MCLITKMKEPTIAEKDIICYKVISKDMTSLYHVDFKWEFGKLYETEMKQTDNPWIEDTMIDEGFHSYKSYKDVKKGYFMSITPCMIVECTIPIGTMYFEGCHGYDTSGYASDQLIINRVIPQEELFPDFDFENFPYKVGQKIKAYYDGTPYNNDTCMTIEEIVPNDKGVYIKTNYIITFMCVCILNTNKEGLPLFNYSPSITIIE